MNKENSMQVEKGVFVSKSAQIKFSDFEQSYLTVRTKEKRVLSIDEIKALPFPHKESPDFDLWKIRRKNIDRFIRHLSAKNKKLRILDIGCGNGFFTNMISLPDNEVVGVDVNLTELQQAAEAFPGGKIRWYYLDILKEKLPEENFDIITFCASFHYFKNPQQLLKICKTLLNPGGEIHIIDSPFYSEEEKPAAKQRSIAHFTAMGVESMSDYYYHNSYEALKDYTYTFAYKPGDLLSKILRIKDSPFPWIILK